MYSRPPESSRVSRLLLCPSSICLLDMLRMFQIHQFHFCPLGLGAVLYTQALYGVVTSIATCSVWMWDRVLRDSHKILGCQNSAVPPTHLFIDRQTLILLEMYPFLRVSILGRDYGDGR